VADSLMGWRPTDMRQSTPRVDRSVPDPGLPRLSHLPPVPGRALSPPMSTVKSGSSSSPSDRPRSWRRSPSSPGVGVIVRTKGAAGTSSDADDQHGHGLVTECERGERRTIFDGAIAENYDLGPTHFSIRRS